MLRLQARLGIESVHLRGAAVHVKENDIARLGLVMRQSRRKDTGGSSRVGRSGAERVIAEQTPESNGAEAVGALEQHLAPGNRRGRKPPAVASGFHDLILAIIRQK